jgi:LDH2 family malate/lactate/ureidoglycolate dehydrogenase
MLGTNPLSIGIPRTGQSPLILDMSTSSITYNQLRQAQREHTQLPPGVAQDQDGNPTTDPFAASSETYRSFILPFAGYKGFGLSFMIELLCDAGLGTPAGKGKVAGDVTASASCNGMYIAYRPDLFVERNVFDARVEQWVADIKDNHKAEDETEIRIPGEQSQRHKAEVLQEGSIDIDESTYAFLRA